MGHKSGIDELVQEVNVSLAMDPMAVGETDLCFPQCIATETAPNLCALSLLEIQVCLLEPQESHQGLPGKEEGIQSMQRTPIPGREDFHTFC